MSKTVKVLLIIGVVLLLGAIAVVGLGVYAWKKYGTGLVESGKQSYEEGRTYGARTDNEGCLTESISRHKTSHGFGDLIRTNVFLNSCLVASRPTPGFCDGVPKRTEFIKSAQWQASQCSKYGLSNENQCGQLFAQVQQYCDLPRAEGK
ncbi:MAG TPA: hypothetical protein VM934_11330 [Pyrinomonadaceae bacterium]|jgi:hypothetical protein|nr:hypothetical protein [Pyrinomonadaceae bacterium]